MPAENPTVYIVDDDPDFRESMSLMVRSMGLNAAVFPSAEAFLDGYSARPTHPSVWCWTFACRALAAWACNRCSPATAMVCQSL